MTEKLAKLLSGVFHPLLLPTYALFILFKLDVYFVYTLSLKGYLLIGLSVFLLSFVVPSLGIAGMKYKGWVKSYEMEDRSERILPLSLMIVTYSVVQLLLKSLLVNSIFNYFLLAMTMLLIVTLVVTFFWKISFHMIGLGGIFGTLLALNFVFNRYIPELIFGPLLISGIVGTARLKLKAHTNAQIYAGFILGASFMFFIFYRLI